MIEFACTCDDLPSHSHIFKPVREWVIALGKETYTGRMEDSGEIRIWVNWKDVARELMRSGT